MCRDCGCEEANHSAQGNASESGEENVEHRHWVNGKWIQHSHRAEGAPATQARLGGAVHRMVPPRRISLELSVLAKNDRIAQENRDWFETHRVQVMNLISSPGSGKTFLLEKTAQHFGKTAPARMAILTGDQEQDFDAQRLKAVGADVLQLNTQSACHLDASMIQKQLGAFVLPEHRLLIIENVGNLVCPASFDLGESMKVALLSTPEGEDKPSKYPLLFKEAGLIVITKMDLVPHLDWSLELCEQHIRKVNPMARILLLSAKTGEGLPEWFDFLETCTA